MPRRFLVLARAFKLRQPSLGRWITGTQVNGAHDFGFVLEAAARLYARRLRERARAISLDPMTCRALLVLADNDDVTQQQLAEAMMVGPMSIGRLLNRLEAERLVSRRAHPQNRRARAVSLTPGARVKLPMVYQTINALLHEALSGTSATDRRMLMNGLHLVLSNLSFATAAAPALESSCGTFDEDIGDIHE